MEFFDDLESTFLSDLADMTTFLKVSPEIKEWLQEECRKKKFKRYRTIDDPWETENEPGRLPSQEMPRVV